MPGAQLGLPLGVSGQMVRCVGQPGNAGVRPLAELCAVSELQGNLDGEAHGAS